MAGLGDYTTRELVAELSRRTAVERVEIAPYESYCVLLEGRTEASVKDKGPATILVIRD